MSKFKTKQREAIEVLTRLDELGLSQRELVGVLEIDENKISKIKGGERRISAGEYIKATEWLDKAEARDGYTEQADLPEVPADRDYLPVDILPSFAGMGGGGTGEGDIERAMISRRLVEDELNARPSDLLVIEARGTSMRPDFEHGDQILIDQRDKNTAQPGAFALWDGDAYLIKMVERLPGGRLRIFSRDRDLSSFEYDADEVTIMGRPVWFGRRL